MFPPPAVYAHQIGLESYNAGVGIGLTVDREPSHTPCSRWLLLGCCLLVFLFALHAKVSVYQQSRPLDAATSSKLWLDGVRHELPPVPARVAPFWLTTIILLLVNQQPERRYRAACPMPALATLSQLYLHRFLRPPPLR